MNEKWKLVVFSEEERENHRKNGETCYKIYERDKTKKFGTYNSEKNALFRFWAKNDADALKILDEWNKDHQDGKEYLYSATGQYVDSNGNCYDSLFDMENANKNMKTKILDFWYDVQYWFYDYWAYKFDSLKYFVKDVWFYVRHYDFEKKKSYSRHDFWSLDYAVLDNMMFQSELLKKHGHTYPSRYSPSISSPEESDEAGKKARDRWHEDISEFQDRIVAYFYYDAYGEITETDEYYDRMKKLEDEKIVEMKYVPGTEDLDYKYIAERQNHWWKKIWEKWEEIGRDMWD